jgi:benzodiazapine receptor
LNPTSRSASIVSFLVCCGATFSAAAFGARFGPTAWYEQLTKPTLNPPNWVFGPVWTALYLMMAIAAWLVWRADGRTQPLGLFAIQLSLNAVWSALFFGLHHPGWALVDIALLWVAVAATLASFWRSNTIAGCLLVPYLAWVTFASYLNFMIWRLNS